MTANQIAFAKLREEERNNLAMEEETRRHNMFQEFLGLLGAQNTAAANAETARSNAAREAETIRANDLTNIRETSRLEINWGEAQIKQQESETKQQQASEAQRHNMAMEQETSRHNKMTEGIDAATGVLKVLSGFAGKFILP